MIYSRLSDSPDASREVKPEYMQAGEACYNAFIRAKGLHDEPAWDNLVWSEQYAWCEAARSARGFLVK
jgi:hypothetical protein